MQYLTAGDGDPEDESGDGRSRPPEKEFHQVIIQEVDRLNRVVSSFLDYARPSREDTEATNVNSVLERTMKLMEVESPGRGGPIEVNLTEGLPPVRIGEEKLAQVFWNLLKNAIEASPDGPSVDVRTRRVRRTPFWSDMTEPREREFVEISIRDRGAGIPRQILSKVFIPFFTTKDNGTGLGLAISHRIIREAGGTIEVDSREGRGSTFTVLLPPAPQVTEDSRPST